MHLRVFKHDWALSLAVIGILDFLTFFSAPYLGVLLHIPDGLLEDERLHRSLWPRALLFAAVVFTAMAGMGLYSPRQRSRIPGRIARLCIAILGGSLVFGGLSYAVPRLSLGRGVLLISALSALVIVVVWRLTMRHLTDHDVFKGRILVLGSGERAYRAFARLRRRCDRRGFVIAGFVNWGEANASRVLPGPRIDRPASLLLSCERLHIDEIVIALDERRGVLPARDLLACQLKGIVVTDLSAFLERETGKVRTDCMNPGWTVFSPSCSRLYLAAERGADILASIFILVASLPIVLATAIAIKVEDGMRAVIFYRQLRVGRHGMPFVLLKFRSMRPDAEDSGAVWAQDDDVRITRVGRFLRKTRIDEIPQLLCVLRGDMSLVGPRPERPEFVDVFDRTIPFYGARHAVKPGITGWAQLCHRYSASADDTREKLQYDLYYIKHRSLIFYLAILVQTVEVMVWGKGAR